MNGPAIVCAPSLKEISDFLVLKKKEKILILYESFYIISEAKESDLHNKSNCLSYPGTRPRMWST